MSSTLQDFPVSPFRRIAVNQERETAKLEAPQQYKHARKNDEPCRGRTIPIT